MPVVPNPVPLAQDEAAPVSPPGVSGVIVVTHRAARGSAALLPPLVIVMLGAGFLAYRVASPDWRGVSGLFARSRSAERPPAGPHAPGPGLAIARADQTNPPAPPPALPKADAPAPLLAETAAAKPSPGPKPEEPPDPGEDIRREAERNQQRIAELEAIKQREARKLDETADARQQDERLDRLQKLPLRRVPPDLARKLAREQDVFRRRIAQLEAFHRRQMERLAEMEREFWNRPRPFLVPGPMPPPPPFPGLGPGPPDGGARFRRFDGRADMGGFVFRRAVPPDPTPAAPDEEESPPPPPRPRRFD